MGFWDIRYKPSGRPSKMSAKAAALDNYLAEQLLYRRGLRIAARSFWKAAMRQRRIEQRFG